MTDFNSLGLAAPLQAALDKLGYTTPTPIQLQAIPDVLNGRDLMGIAQTGTGKTAAFALPTLSYLVENPKDLPKRGARVLVLAPTRELASQIAVSFKDYGQEMDELDVEVIFGGVGIPGQIKRLVPGNDVLVATPGRLLDLVNRKAITLKDIEILILDEADQMMDMGFIHDLRKIVKFIPEERQTLFFSATMAPNILKLSKQYLDNPVKVSVAPPNTTAEKVEQSVIFVNGNEKQDLLAITLLDPEIDRALVFTRTKHGANKVVKKLAQVGIDSMAIHGNKSQNQRQKALAAFRSGEIKVLIATDVAARGIDIEGISHVINFEIPNVPEQYVHRIGRTARAGRNGLAIAFVNSEERAYLKDIQKLLKMTIPVGSLPDDFNGKARALKSRTPIVREDGPKQQGRKGRGKSRNSKRGGPKGKPQGGGGRGPKREGPKGEGAKGEARGESGGKPQGQRNAKPKTNNNGERGRVTLKGSSSGPESTQTKDGPTNANQGRAQGKRGNEAKSGKPANKPHRRREGSVRSKAPGRG